MKFDHYSDLTHHLAEAVIARISNHDEIGARQGHSNVSCSAYVNVTFMEADEDGDYCEVFGGCKVRFSDHADHYGSDLSIIFNNALDSDELYDVELADWRISEMVDEAVEFIEAQFKEQSDD